MPVEVEVLVEEAPAVEAPAVEAPAAEALAAEAPAAPAAWTALSVLAKPAVCIPSLPTATSSTSATEARLISSNVRQAWCLTQAAHAATGAKGSVLHLLNSKLCPAVLILLVSEQVSS